MSAQGLWTKQASLAEMFLVSRIYVDFPPLDELLGPTGFWIARISATKLGHCSDVTPLFSVSQVLVGFLCI